MFIMNKVLRARIELTFLLLQSNALTAKPSELWRKRDSNSYCCDANTKDYHYLISPFYILFCKLDRG